MFSLTPGRLDRLPIHLSHWSGNMSIAIQLEESELPLVADVITKTNRSNIRFTLYILKDIHRPSKGTFLMKQYRRVYFPSCFACNVLRDLAIETIQSTHYFLIDGDAIITSTKLNAI